MCSIASTGYGLAAVCIGAKRGFIGFEEAYQRVKGTLLTLRDNLDEYNGFYYHFINIFTGERYKNSEVSVIDTAIAICGALTAGEYFGGEVKELAEQLYNRVDWTWYLNPETQQFYMGYMPETGFFGTWDMTAEQFMMYILGAGSPTHPISGECFYIFERPVGVYGSIPEVIHSPRGSLFVYLFSHMWLDFKGYTDKKGVDWFLNSKYAVLANRQYAVDNAEKYGTGPDNWGFTACDGPGGYTGDYGSPPAFMWSSDGTVATYVAASSLPFIPEYSISAIKAQYKIPGLVGNWGLKDSYNKSGGKLWIGEDTIGIDKGSALIMIENYLTEMIWKLMSGIDAIRLGYKKCGLERNGV
jgi:hypothetical protein